MNHVIVYGSQKDRQISSTLQSLLEQSFLVNYLSGTCISSGKQSTQNRFLKGSPISDSFRERGVSAGIHTSKLINPVSQKETSPEINLIETNSLQAIEIKNGILVIKSDASLGALRHVDKSTNIIIDSAGGSRSATHLMKSLPYAYTCGFNSKDFVTFSSRDDDQAVVSLQRRIHIPSAPQEVKMNSCISTSFTDPFEIPCFGVGGLKDYTVLSSVLVLLLLGIINENKSKEIGKIYF